MKGLNSTQRWSRMGDLGWLGFGMGLGLDLVFGSRESLVQFSTMNYILILQLEIWYYRLQRVNPCQFEMPNPNPKLTNHSKSRPQHIHWFRQVQTVPPWHAQNTHQPLRAVPPTVEAFSHQCNTRCTPSGIGCRDIPIADAERPH